MTHEQTDLPAKVILGLAVVVYLVVSPIANHWTHKHREGSWLASITMWLTAPGCISLLALAALLSIPYYFLFPERHATALDFEGTPEEQQAMREYRLAVGRIPFWRRLMGRFGLLKLPDVDFPGRELIEAHYLTSAPTNHEDGRPTQK